MRNNTPAEITVAETLDTILADLTATLAGLHRPAALIAAEQVLIEARERRAAAWRVYTDTIREFGKSQKRLANVEAAALLAAKTALAAADAEIGKAQRAVDRLREQHGATVVASIAEYRAGAAVAIDRASRILAATAAVAAAEHVKLPVLPFPPENRGHIVEMMNKAAWQENDRAQRAFSTAATAMSARARPQPQEAVSLRWRAPLADLVGGIVEGPVRVRPRSADTREKIPASTLDRAIRRG